MIIIAGYTGSLKSDTESLGRTQRAVRRIALRTTAAAQKIKKQISAIFLFS